MSSYIIKQRRRTGAYSLLQFAKGQLFMRIDLNKNVSTNFVLIIFLINGGRLTIFKLGLSVPTFGNSRYR